MVAQPKGRATGNEGASRAGAVGNFADRFAWGERVCYLS